MRDRPSAARSRLRVVHSGETLYGQVEASILIESTFSFGAGAAVLVAPAVALGLVDRLASSIVPVISTLWPRCGAILACSASSSR